MKISDIRERSDGELVTLTTSLYEDLYKLRVQKATNQLENTNAPRQIKKDLAKALTIIQARKLGLEAKKETAV
jgi:ribosomal protein L29